MGCRKKFDGAGRNTLRYFGQLKISLRNPMDLFYWAPSPCTSKKSSVPPKFMFMPLFNILWEWVKVGTNAVNFIYCVNVPAPPKRYYTLLFSIFLLRFFSIIQLSLKFLLSFIVLCVVRGRESCMGNGIQNSFHNVLKRILYSVS